jgi:succinyl-diaminopimelate desuccinylase
VISFRSGTVVNAVPAEAVAVVSGTDALQRLEKAAETAEGTFRFEQTEQGVTIISTGRAHHGSEPELGFNAASHLAALLSLAFPAEELGGFLRFLNGVFGTETDGASAGVKMCDGQSGPLTLNLGIVRADADGARADIDIRYPVTKDGAPIFSALQADAEQYGLTAELLYDNKPLFFPAEHPLIHLLQDAYRAVEGVPAELYSMGGGTYAREIPGRAVAFGAYFPDQPDVGMHTANEHLQLDRYLEHAQICLEAMYRMMTE